MKPRERTEQAQSSRMVLRNADHRDAIYNDMYHNVIWANTEDIDDELVWIKYPKKALMHRVKPFTGWMDVDRQFCYGINMDAGQRYGNFYKLRNGLVLYYGAYSGLSDDGFYAIEDGIIWHDITDQLSYMPIAQMTMYLGDDCVAWLWGDDYWHGGGDKRHIVWTRVYKDDEGEFKVLQGQFVFDCDTSWINWGTALVYCGTVNDTIIVMKEVMDYYNQSAQQWFFSVSKTGHVEMLSDPVPQPTFMCYISQNVSGYSYTQQGNRLFFTLASVTSYDGYANRYSAITTFSSMDGGHTWTKNVVVGGHNLNDYNDQQGGVQHRTEMFQRDGEVFLLCGQACDSNNSGWHEVHLYSTYTGTSWDEISLPAWVDLPVLNEYSGQGVDLAGVDTVRVAVRPNDATSQDYNMFDLIARYSLFAGNTMDVEHGNIMFQDGEVKSLLDTDFYMVIGTGSLHLYFDNRHMAENAKAFAWYTKAYDSQADGADYIQNGDYCVAYNPVPFDPSQYMFWDYYKWNAEILNYERVPRVTIPSYPRYSLVVVEYLPQTGANNVLYKVPRYNV